MCFSANASFGAGVLLVVIGIASVKKVHHSSQLMFASIPLIFGIQQIAEGILWLSLPNPDNINTHKIATYVFLLFAQVIWPIWVPASFLLVDRSTSRRNMQKFLLLAGLFIGIYLAYCLFTFNVQAKIVEHHIVYLQEYPTGFKNYGIFLYALATIIPSFISHIKHMWLLGMAVLISYIVSAIFYEYYILSVWCFFSSIISLFVYVILSEIINAEQRKLKMRYVI